jgi:hypothetical protein
LAGRTLAFLNRMASALQCLILSLSLIAAFPVFAGPKGTAVARNGLSHAKQIPIETSSEDYQRMETFLVEAIQRDPELMHEAAAVGLAIADVYVRNHDYQEAIWALDRSGHYAHAEKLVSDYETFLKTANIVNVRDVGIGITAPVIIEFENGSRAILKHPDSDVPNSDQYEVGTYEFDRKVGFNLTATTVARNIGGVDYVIVGFIEGARNSEIDLDDYANPKYPDLYLLDFIIGQWDRHGNNSMFAKTGRLFGVDNGRIGKPGFRSQFDSHIVPSSQLLKNLSELSLNDDFKRFCDKMGPGLEFMTGKIQTVKSLFSANSWSGKKRPNSKEARLALAETKIEISVANQKTIEEFKNDILKRSKVRAQRPPTENGTIAVTRETLNVYLTRPESLAMIMKNGDVSKLMHLYDLAKSDEALKIKFFQNLLLFSAPLNEELSRKLGDLLSQEASTFPEIFIYPFHAMKSVPLSKALQTAFLQYVKTLDSNSYSKSDLLTKFIEVKLAHTKDTSHTVNELLDVLEQTGMEKLVRNIPPRLKVSSPTGDRLWAMYIKGSTRGYFPIGTLDPYLQSAKLTTAQESELLKRLAYLKEISTVTEVLKLMEQSPNRARLIQLFKVLIPRATESELPVGYLAFEFAKAHSPESAGQIFKQVANQVRPNLLADVSRIFEEKDSIASWKPILSVLLQRDPSAVPKKLAEYKGRNAYFKVDEAVFSMDAIKLQKYLTPNALSSKHFICDSFLQ